MRLRPLPCLISLSLLSGVALGIQPKVPSLHAVIVSRYPHATNAFTEGLQYLGDGVYLESTGTLDDSVSGVRKMDLKTAAVKQEMLTPISGAFGEGSTLLGGIIYHITWQNRIAFALDSVSLQEIKRFEYKTEGWGITNDGSNLIMSDGSNKIVWRDPHTFDILKTINVKNEGKEIDNLNELEYIQGNIYANIWLSNKIARINPETGDVTAWIDVTNLEKEALAESIKRGRALGSNDVANGIAFNSQKGTLLVTGKRWPLMFEVKILGIKPDKK